MRFVSWKKKKATRSILRFLLCRPRTRPLPRCSFVHLLIHQFIYLHRPLVSSGVVRLPQQRVPHRGRFVFPLRLPSLFYCPLRIPSFLDFIPSGPLSSLVECLTLERVWGTGRSGRRGFVAQWRRRRRGDTWQGWTHDGGKVGGVVRKQWNADQNKVNLMRLNRPTEETTLSTLSWNHRLWSS